MRPYRSNVAIVVIDDEGRVLVGERSDKPGCWQVPQGGVDDGEDEEKAAYREFAEEVGEAGIQILACTENRYCYEFPQWLDNRPIAQKYRGQRQRYFLAKRTNGKEPGDGATHAEFVRFDWRDVGLLLKQVSRFKRKAYEGALRELAPTVNEYLGDKVWKISD